MQNNTTLKLTAALLLALAAAGCSTTSSLEPGEQLYTGMKKTVYVKDSATTASTTLADHFNGTQEELEAVLACPPNGALFGSSYYRTPLPWGLWIWNAFSQKKGAIPKWLTSSFGKAPVLISDVKPELRMSVANTVLENNGYFRGSISYKIHEGKPTTTRRDSILRPHKAKVSYTVSTGPVFTLDSIAYRGFSDEETALFQDSTTFLHKNDPFSVTNLENERNRLYKIFRDNGYYYYQPQYSTYAADTIQKPGHVQLVLHKADSLPEEASRKWYIGNTDFRIRRNFAEQLTDSVTHRTLTVHYAGKKPALRPRVVLKDILLRRRRLFSQTNYEESLTRLSQKGIFSYVNINFTPRDIPQNAGNAGTDTTHRDSCILDMTVDCILDKPYDISTQLNYTQKSNGRLGPGAGVSFAMRNAFRGGELLSFNISGNYEFNVGKNNTGKNGSYNIVTDLTLELPRLLLPDFMRPDRRRFRRKTTANGNTTLSLVPTSANTILRIARETINRTGSYWRHVLSGELTYNYKPNEVSRHSFTPLSIDYSYVAESTEEFWDKMENSVVALIALEDNFLPKMRYSYSYTSPASKHHPIYFSGTVTECGNAANGILSLGKRKWNEEGKTMFNAPVGQFVKLDLEWRKLWQINRNASLIAHALGGWMITYGNTSYAPFSEQYYVGGANDLRGFSTRSVGPGSFRYQDPEAPENENKEMNYMLSNGDMKLKFSLEYRPRLFGSLYGAAFIDAGNVWTLDKSRRNTEGMGFRLKNLPKDLAVDAGIGIRYDLDFFIIRLDWAFVVHAPYYTGKSGYFNTPKFSKAQCLNFAIGYPF
ncbi:MAG: BamA/TamA family outer membrane protein [Bacteroidales bacterium]|nr:BamA/TamA family outer membrane protein [Bacteroidales bacterium]MCM1147897.1 BamA/TamA family outer membrane protein [Bacteroidales bacterium]MCM1205446.1 BamA/TamA family outer membrane protein [Bacillota bacterium]MCM1509292.1 BamA/TamA family outer membrane protein [Clostridium sp.]